MSRARSARALASFIFYTLLPAIGISQTRNPDVSIITDFRAFSHSDSSRLSEENDLNLNLEEIELALQGYLNPYARADVFIAKHGVEGEVEIEEAYVTFLRGLPLGLNVKAGKYLVDFGKLNVLHSHAYPFVELPLAHREYFGEDGLNDTGINVSALLPTKSFYSQLSLNVLKGDFVGHGHEEAEAPEQEETSETEDQELAYSGRLLAHFQVGDYSNLEIGFNGLTAQLDPHEDLRFHLAGFDFKYKWTPNRYTSLTLQGETMWSRRKVVRLTDEMPADEFKETVSTASVFGFVNWQFRQRWNVGAMGEWLQAPDNEDEEFWSASGYAGFSPMEESSVIRLLLRRETAPNLEAFNTALMQIVFALGPHRPHAF